MIKYNIQELYLLNSVILLFKYAWWHATRVTLKHAGHLHVGAFFLHNWMN